MSGLSGSDEALLNILQRETFGYFANECNLDNGLIPDKTARNWPSSIAATGLALPAYPIGVQRGFLWRASAVERVLATLRVFRDSAQGVEPDATGYKGFYYHFLPMQTGKRAWHRELSTIDSTFLLAGMLAAAQYFGRDTPEEREIREVAEELYRRAEWQWAQNGGATVSHGWSPEGGFLPYRRQGYDEAPAAPVSAAGGSADRDAAPERAGSR